MMGLFRKVIQQLCIEMDMAAKGWRGCDVEMESLFSRLTLHVIGKAAFNYDFDSLSNDTGIVEVRFKCILLLNQSKS
jgi:beta-ring hydroxylase